MWKEVWYRMSEAPPQDERPNLRTDESGRVIVDLKDSLSKEEEMSRLDEIIEIVEEEEYELEKAQERIDERFKE
jgi:DNA polymerase IIIc chi subunit